LLLLLLLLAAAAAAAGVGLPCSSLSRLIICFYP
jgi:hypothetical protein